MKTIKINVSSGNYEIKIGYGILKNLPKLLRQVNISGKVVIITDSNVSALYLDELKALNGNDKEVRDFVMQYPAAHEFIEKLESMMKFLIAHYIDEGKSQLVISIGCTGGKHRSVTLANELYERLSGGDGYGLRIEHRDIPKDALRK